MGFSIQAQALVLAGLLVALIVLVAIQLTGRRAAPEWPSSPPEGGSRREMVVWAAIPAAFGGMIAGLLAYYPLLWVPLRLMLGFVPDALAIPWFTISILGPCAILGYLSGRWWSFVGATPMLLFWPVGVMFAGSAATVNEDLFATLPLTVAIAVALSLGSAARFWRNRRLPVRSRRAAPAGIAPRLDVPQPPMAAESPRSQPPYWPPPPGWKPTSIEAAKPAAESGSPPQPQPQPSQPPYWPPPPAWKPAPTQVNERKRRGTSIHA